MYTLTYLGVLTAVFGCVDMAYRSYRYTSYTYSTYSGGGNSVVGAIVGGVIAFIGIGTGVFFLIYCCYCKKKNKIHSPGATITTGQTVSAPPPAYNPSPGFAPQQGQGYGMQPLQQNGYGMAGQSNYADPYAPPTAAYPPEEPKSAFTYS